MFTTIKDKDGKTYNFVTQEYEIGTYVIVNSDPALQSSSNLKEEDFHIDLRKKSIKKGNEIIAGNIIKRKSKINLNPFVNDNSN